MSGPDHGAVDRPAIRIRGLTKSFGPVRALADIDLDVAPGSYVALMGPNGSGKTTLLKVVAGLAVPSGGSVSVAGADMRRAGPGVRRLIGYVAHESMLYADLTARENLEFHARLFEVERPEAVVEAIAGLLGAAGVLDRRVGTLSRGTRQRVSLARALLHGPPILLLDEPYTGLDEVAAAAFAEVLDGLHAPDRIVVVSTHDVSRAMGGPDRLVALSRGRVALDVPLDTRGADVAEAYSSLLRAEAAR